MDDTALHVELAHPFSLGVRNSVDHHGNPAGGTVKGTGLSVRWQDGPLRVPIQPAVGDSRLGSVPSRNGAFVEDVIDAAITRLRFYQSSKFACEENEIALDLLMAARGQLDERTKARLARGVEGTHEV